MVVQGSVGIQMPCFPKVETTKEHEDYPHNTQQYLQVQENPIPEQHHHAGDLDKKILLVQAQNNFIIYFFEKKSRNQTTDRQFLFLHQETEQLQWGNCVFQL